MAAAWSNIARSQPPPFRIESSVALENLSPLGGLE
jgi:hypothetical protein